MRLDASYSNVSASPYRKRFTNGEMVKFLTGDIFAVTCAFLVGGALLFMPWLTTAGGGTGLKYLFEGIWTISAKGIPVMLLIPLVAIVGVLATAWRLLDFNAGKTPIFVTAAAGVAGLVYYAVTLSDFGAKELDPGTMTGIGYWVALLGCIGLVLQVVIPRPAFQISLRSREAIIAYLFIAPFFIFFSVFVIRSVITAVQMSFYDWAILLPKRPYVGLANYNELLNDYVWRDALKNTLQFAIITVTGTTLISLLAAVAVTQPIKGAGFFRVLLYMPSLLSVGVVGLTWVWLLNTQFGIINYGLSFLGVRPVNWLGDPNLVIPALSLTTMWWGFGFPMLIFIAGLQGIPDHLYEAASIDGANGRQKFLYITIPLLRPTILFVTVTGFISHFQVFGQPFIMTNGGPGRSSYTAIFYLYQIAWVAFRMGFGSAVAITLAAIIAFFTALQFFFVGRRNVDY